jgi:hypothetical protein
MKFSERHHPLLFTLPLRGRVGSHRAQRNARRGGVKFRAESLRHPTPPLRVDPPPPGEGEAHTSAISRHHSPEFCKIIRSKKQRAQGRPGARCTRGPVCKSSKQKRTRAYRFSGNTPAFPAQWLYGLFRALPGETWLACHRHSQEARASQELDTCHRGVRTTRLCRTLQCRSSRGTFASIAPRIQRPWRSRNAPLAGAGWRKK